MEGRHSSPKHSAVPVRRPASNTTGAPEQRPVRANSEDEYRVRHETRVKIKADQEAENTDRAVQIRKPVKKALANLHQARQKQVIVPILTLPLHITYLQDATDLGNVLPIGVVHTAFIRYSKSSA